MATGTTIVQSGESVNLAPLLEDIAKKLANTAVLRHGTILVRTIGPQSQDYYLEASARGVELTLEAPEQMQPVIEITGDAKVLRDVLVGRSKATKRFLMGGFRLHGDLRYLSDLALELGFITTPL